MGLCGSLPENPRPENPDVVAKDHFILGRVVGEGGFGKVYAVQQWSTLEWYALKELSKSASQRQARSHRGVRMLLNERKMLEEAPVDPFLVNLHYAFQDAEKCYLVLDLARGGDLDYHLRKKGRFTERRTRFYATCIALGLRALHENGIVHLDVKPSNVVIDAKGYAQLADFGLAKRVEKDGTVSGSAGTKAYMPPECFTERRRGRSADVFALGITVAVMLTRCNAAEVRKAALDCSTADGGIAASPSGTQLARNSDLMLAEALSPRLGRSKSEEGADAANDAEILGLGHSATKQCCAWLQSCTRENPGARQQVVAAVTHRWIASRFELDKFCRKEYKPDFVPRAAHAYFDMSHEDMQAGLEMLGSLSPSHKSRKPLEKCASAPAKAFTFDDDHVDPFADYDYRIRVEEGSPCRTLQRSGTACSAPPELEGTRSTGGSEIIEVEQCEVLMNLPK